MIIRGIIKNKLSLYFDIKNANVAAFVALSCVVLRSLSLRLKGCYLFQLSKGEHPELVKKSNWVIR
jgi:hypothetical protein